MNTRASALALSTEMLALGSGGSRGGGQGRVGSLRVASNAEFSVVARSLGRSGPRSAWAGWCRSRLGMLVAGGGGNLDIRNFGWHGGGFTVCEKSGRFVRTHRSHLYAKCHSDLGAATGVVRSPLCCLVVSFATLRRSLVSLVRFLASVESSFPNAWQYETAFTWSATQLGTRSCGSSLEGLLSITLAPNAGCQHGRQDRVGNLVVL